MFAIASLCFIATLLVTTVVGVRLLAVARKTRQIPEFAMGLCGVSYSFGCLVRMAAQRMSDPSPQATMALIALGTFFLAMGSVSTGLAVWRIFRPNTRWARNLFCGLAGLTSVLWLSAMFSYDPSSPGATWALSREKSLIFLAMGMISIWAVFECLHGYRTMKRRVQIGLCDPLAANQFLIWGLSLCVAVFTIIIELYFNQILNITFLHSSAILLLVSILALTSNAGMLMAFFPPKAYRNWIAAHSMPESHSEVA